MEKSVKFENINTTTLPRELFPMHQSNFSSQGIKNGDGEGSGGILVFRMHVETPFSYLLLSDDNSPVEFSFLLHKADKINDRLDLPARDLIFIYRPIYFYLLSSSLQKKRIHTHHHPPPKNPVNINPYKPAIHQPHFPSSKTLLHRSASPHHAITSLASPTYIR